MKKGDLVRLNAAARCAYPRMKDTGPWCVRRVDEYYGMVTVERVGKSGKIWLQIWDEAWLEMAEEGDVHE